MATGLGAFQANLGTLPALQGPIGQTFASNFGSGSIREALQPGQPNDLSVYDQWLYPQSAPGQPGGGSTDYFRTTQQPIFQSGIAGANNAIPHPRMDTIKKGLGSAVQRNAANFVQDYSIGTGRNLDILQQSVQDFMAQRQNDI